MFAGVRAAELALLALDDVSKEAFVRMQYAAQDRAYRLHAPEAGHDIVLLDGEPVGRIVVDQRRDEIRVMDIALLPEWRGAGIGTVLLERVVARADATGAVTTMHVALDNRARSLYERLGFAEVSRDAVYARLERSPRQPNTAS